jgi:hypothetical protein
VIVPAADDVGPMEPPVVVGDQTTARARTEPSGRQFNRVSGYFLPTLPGLTPLETVTMMGGVDAMDRPVSVTVPVRQKMGPMRQRMGE